MTSQKPLTASIVISTCNRASYLQRLLSMLTNVQGVQFEIVIVNGPSTDGTENILKQYEGFIKVVSYAGRNLSVSRNLGIAQAAGDIVVFIDDDALPANDNWLAEYLQAFQQNPHISMAWGSVLRRDTDWFEFQGGATSEYGFQSFRETAVDDKAPDGTSWVARGPGGNLAFRRANLIEAGGFDETYKYYLDESDVCFRLNQAGYEGLFLASNNIRHFAARSEQGQSIYDRNWDVITKSDTYFALKNSQDAFFTRLLKTLRFANQKHFVIEIDSYLQKKQITFSHWLRLRWMWLRGLMAGFMLGIFQPMRLGSFNSAPAPFLPFGKPPLPVLNASIVINTFNRAPYLQRLLPALMHLKNAQFEVIVVNGPSTDGTENILKQYEGFIKVVSYAGRNLSVSRNLGIAQAAGDIVVFIDDDALPANDNWLAEYLQAFQQNPLISMAWGAVLHRDTDWFEFQGGATSEYAFQSFRETAVDDKAPDGTSWVARGPGGNLAFRRDKLIEVGGFDEAYKYYLDETDVCFRLNQAGYEGLFLPTNNIRHFSASSERRQSIYDRNWDVITKSDTYFALKNSRDNFFTRLLKTLRFANQKHFVIEIDSYRQKQEISRSHWLRLRWKWLRGLLAGLLIGIFQPRKLGVFNSTPAPFLPFKSNPAKEPLHIALITKTYPGQVGFGGIGRYTYDLARGLHELGHQVHLICYDESPRVSESLNFVIHGITQAEIDSIYTNLPNLNITNKNIAYSLAIEHKLKDLYQQGIEFDVVHATNWDIESISLIRERVYPLALMLVTPLAQVIQTENWEYNKDLQTSVQLDRWHIQQADVVCVPSNGVLKSYQSLMGMTPQEMQSLQVTSLGIIPKVNTATVSKKGYKKLLFVGRLERRKGIHTLLQILPELMQQFQDWECHIVGNDSLQMDGSLTYAEQFQQDYAQSAWFNRVIFHGAVSEEELLAHYQTCDLFTAPSLFESFGLIYQEAMQFAKPVIGCRTGGIPEVVENGKEGILVEPDNPAELKQALITLMSDEALRNSMGLAGYERIHQRDNYLSMASRLEQVYRNIIQAKGEEYSQRRKSLWATS
ncbi:MAG: glycosyl transferase group 1 protein [Chloroflexi bacterium OLB14]|nr:MAG: glycosyl transferase group 1 protein [Chloroflexi bacterium OLB14]